MEVYGLLRNSKICTSPIPAAQAVEVIQTFRSNPAWKIVDLIQDLRGMNHVWKQAGKNQFAFQRIYDCRMAMILKQHHVTEFATRNLKNFKDQGFERVWDPFTV
jgi:predicted nucleic acid-binding protein